MILHDGTGTMIGIEGGNGHSQRSRKLKFNGRVQRYVLLYIFEYINP
jgi:hypothetical protein